LERGYRALVEPWLFGESHEINTALLKGLFGERIQGSFKRALYSHGSTRALTWLSPKSHVFTWLYRALWREKTGLL